MLFGDRAEHAPHHRRLSIIVCEPAPFERLSYTEAIAALEKSSRTFEFPVRWGMDLQSEHERWLSEEHVKAPVVVMNYPKEIKAFYMRMNDDGKTVAKIGA